MNPHQQQDRDTGPIMRSEASSEQPDLKRKFLTDIFLIAPIGVYIVQDGKFQFVNPEFQKITGFREDELLGSDSLNIVVPEDRGSVRENAIKMLKGERSSPYGHRVKTKDGEIRWIIETVTSVRYGGRRATLGKFMDDTERERAKEALRLSEEKFQKAFRASPDWLVISTLEGGFYIDVNEAFLRTTGYRREEVVGRSSNELGIWADPDIRVKMVETLRQKGAVRELEARFRMKSGEIRYVLWSAEVIDYGEKKCLIAVTRDITARKRAEAERLKREKVQGVLEMAGATCHELNQPLQCIYLILNEILEKHPDNEDIEEIKKQFARIREITTKLQGITTYETKEYISGSRIVDIDKASKTP
jgi:PAS domain S-box-containing protein